MRRVRRPEFRVKDGKLEFAAGLANDSGDVIAVDRQTSVAVDIAEHVAAKTALQTGAAELAERLLPKLVK